MQKDIFLLVAVFVFPTSSLDQKVSQRNDEEVVNSLKNDLLENQWKTKDDNPIRPKLNSFHQPATYLKPHQDLLPASDELNTGRSYRYKRNIATYCVPNTRKCLEFATTNKKIYYVENNSLYSEKFGVIIILLENNIGEIMKEIIIGNQDTYSTVVSKYSLKNGMNYKDKYKIRVYRTDSKNNHVDMSNLFEISNNALVEYMYDLKEVIKVNNLGNINNNSDEIILNELNYLNQNLDISEIEITEKDSQSAVISAREDSKEYTGNVKIYFLTGNTKNKVVDLARLMRKALFFENKRFITTYTIKKVYKIYTDNLIYSDVEVTKSFEPILNNSTKNICSGKTILENKLSEEQHIKTSACRYTIEKIETSQITEGLSRTTGNEISEERGTGSSQTNSETIGSENTVKNTQTSSTKTGVEANAGIMFLGIFNVGGSVSHETESSSAKETSTTDLRSTTNEYMTSMTESLSKTISLSNNIDLSNTSVIQQKQTYQLELPEQDINVKMDQLLEVHFFLDEVTAQVSLDLKQNIYGHVNYETIDVQKKIEKYEISLEYLMKTLDHYGLLPDEITVNDNDSITFNGKASISKQISTYGQIKLREIPKNNSESLNKNNVILSVLTLLYYIMYQIF